MKQSDENGFSEANIHHVYKRSGNHSLALLAMRSFMCIPIGGSVDKEDEKPPKYEPSGQLTGLILSTYSLDFGSKCFLL